MLERDKRKEEYFFDVINHKFDMLFITMFALSPSIKLKSRKINFAYINIVIYIYILVKISG